MPTQPLALGISAINLALIGSLALTNHPASPTSPTEVLQTRRLEIVDRQGHPRATLSVEPATTVDGRLYPETVLLRMIDPEKGPLVKLTVSREGAALRLSDDSEGGIELYTRAAGNSVRVRDRQGKVKAGLE